VDGFADEVKDVVLLPLLTVSVSEPELLLKLLSPL
jgi:hypothetical protein